EGELLLAGDCAEVRVSASNPKELLRTLMREMSGTRDNRRLDRLLHSMAEVGLITVVAGRRVDGRIPELYEWDDGALIGSAWGNCCAECKRLWLTRLRDSGCGNRPFDIARDCLDAVVA